MQRFANDPFGCKLMKSNQPKKDKDAKKEEEKPAGGGSGGNATMPYVTVSNYMFAGPVACAPYPGFYQFVNGYPQIPFGQVMAIPQPVPAAGNGGNKEKAPPPHECVACNTKNKCKKCLQKEEEEKKLVVKRSFCSPRASYRPSIFSNRVIRSD